MIRLVALSALLACTACSDRPEAPAPEPRTAAAWHERGRAIYNFRCYYCHGYSGDARTLAATYMERKPSNFTILSADSTTPRSIGETITQGRTGTAMKGFRDILSEQEIRAVADFVYSEFVRSKAPNTRYHTLQNGWPDHQQYRDAFPFATGAIALNRPPAELSIAEQRGRALFMRSCISCHDRSHVTTQGETWTPVEPTATPLQK